MFGGRLGTGEILILVALLVLVFGWKRLPDAARSLGRSMRIFKSEVQEMKEDGKPSAASKDTVRGEALRDEDIRPTPVREPVREPVRDDAVRDQAGAGDPLRGNAVREDAPRTDNTSGPVA